MPNMAIQGLGWFVRRTAEATALARFYRDALQLPLLRSWEGEGGAGAMMYAGGVTVFEVNTGGQPPPADPTHARCTPIFRVRDLVTVRSQSQKAGAWVVGENPSPVGHTVFLSDPKGYVFGLRAADDAVALAQDSDAALHRAAGEGSLSSLEPMPDAILDLGAVRLKVEDPVALSAFYADMFGFAVLGECTPAGARLHLGNTGALELIPGGSRSAPPKDRIDVTDVWILRVYDYVGLKAHMAVNGVHMVNRLELPGGWIDYYADPEGHVFGIQERKAPDPSVPNTLLAEDIAARKRWEAKQ